MSRKGLVNLAASVRQRLLNVARNKGEDFNLVLIRYASERLLYRLVVAGYREQFILKGAMLFAIWADRPHRPTRDLDLLGDVGASPEELSALFQKICRTKVVPDGLEFDASAIQVEDIRPDQEYHGQRVKLAFRLGTARSNLQIDVGFGDVVTPEAEEIEYPTLLDLPAPKILVYPPETFVAEKLHAMVALGMLNSRMRDFYDLWVMAGRFPFDGPKLVAAIKATFNRRRTRIPDQIPPAFNGEFSSDTGKITQWNAFLRRTGIDSSNQYCPVKDFSFSDNII